jgi:hypothetical protein
MAGYLAVPAVGQAIVLLLQDHYRPGDFNTPLDFRLYLARDFAEPMNAGVSVFLYRIFQNGMQKNHTWRPADGMASQTVLPLDLHFLLSIWAQDASMQHTIAGWMMRTIQDTPVLPASFLNRQFPGLFRREEVVTITPAELGTEELFRIWEVIVNHSYQLSIPYVARMVRIESEEPSDEGGRPVQERIFDTGRPTGDGS